MVKRLIIRVYFHLDNQIQQNISVGGSGDVTVATEDQQHTPGKIRNRRQSVWVDKNNGKCI